MLPLLPLLLCLQSPADPGTCYRFRVFEPDATRRQALEQRFGDDCGAHQADGSIEVIVAPEELGEFRALGLASVTLVERGRPFREIREELRQRGPLAPDPNYYTVAELDTLLTNLEAQYPALCRKINVTQLVGGPLTHDGQSITALKISDNPAVMEDEPAVLIVAQHHARELNSTHMVIGAAQRLLQGYASDAGIRQIVDSHELWLIPCVNPDGTTWCWNVDNLWRKNRRNNGGGVFGVDNNRNYSFYWNSATCGGSTATSNETYRGPSALSEPENQVLDRLGTLLRPEQYLDFHSSGQQVLNTYNSCAREPANATTLLNFFRDDLRNQMTYGFRDPSASGEAPEHHWVQSGTLSYLTEISTAFQPVWSSTVAEEARVWPGIRRALDWQPALRGHVRAVCGNTPLAAEILVPQMGFVDGERNFAEATFGRYKAWLPPGTFTVTFRATGYQDFTTSVTVGAFNVTQTLDVFLVPTGAPATLQRTGAGQPGTPVQLTYQSPGDAGRDYWVAMALGSVPGIALGSRTVPINGDALFLASLNLFPILVNNLGVLPAGDTVVATFNVPPVPALVGLTFWFDGITLDPSCQAGVRAFSPSLSVTIQP